MKPIDPRLVRRVPAVRGYLAASALIALAQTGVIVAIAWLLTDALTSAFAGELRASTVGWLCAAIVVRAGLLWLNEWLGVRAAAATCGRLRSELFDALDRLGPSWLAQRSDASLAVTATRGLEALEPYFAKYIPSLIGTAVTVPIIALVIWVTDWPSGVTIAITLPLIPIFMVLIGMATRSAQEKQFTILQQLAARFADTVQGLTTLRVFGREKRAVSSIRTVADDYRRETMKVLRLSFASGFALELLSSIAVALVAVSIGFRLLSGDLVLFTGLFVLLLVPDAFLPVRQVGVQFHAASEGVAATEAIFEVLDAADASHPGASLATPELLSSRASAADTAANGPDLRSSVAPATVTFADVAVQRGEHTLAPVSFTAKPGSVTLISGPSGAGKSSLFAALLGFTPYSGAISLDPAGAVAWAGQRPGLVAGTIADNVRLGTGDPGNKSRLNVAESAERAPNAADSADRACFSTADLVSEALRLAGAAELDPATELGVQGAGLSGGQAQRVAVARAIHYLLAGCAGVLALDEPSAALDPETESALWRNIRSLADEGATVLLISHRGSAEAIADQHIRIEPALVAASPETDAPETAPERQGDA